MPGRRGRARDRPARIHPPGGRRELRAGVNRCDARGGRRRTSRDAELGLRADGAGAWRPALGGERFVPGTGAGEQPHARRCGVDLRGSGHPPTTTSSTTSARGCTWCRATATSSRSRRWRPAARSGSTTRASTSSTTFATPRSPPPGSRGAVALAGRADPLPAPGPRPSRCGRPGSSRASRAGASR